MASARASIWLVGSSERWLYLVGDDQIEQAAPAKRAIGAQAVDGREVVRLGAETVWIESLDGRIPHGRRRELLQRLVGLCADPGRLIFEPRLVGHDLSCLGGAGHAVEALERLPSHPGKLVVVPHDHERPPGPGILDIGVVQVRPVQRAIVGKRRRHMKTGHRFAVGVANQIAQPPIVAASAGRVFGIGHDLVHEIAQVQHEVEIAAGWRAFVFGDHAAIRMLRAFADVLAAHEREVDRALRVRRRRGAGAPDAAPGPVGHREAIPVGPRRAQTADEHAARVIGRCPRSRLRVGDDAGERGVFCDFDGQRRIRQRARRQPRPQDDAVGSGISGCDAFGESLAPFDPAHARRLRAAAGVREGGADGRSGSEEGTASQRTARFIGHGTSAQLPDPDVANRDPGRRLDFDAELA